MPASQHDLQKRVDQIHWYHEFDFGHGVKTPKFCFPALWAMTEKFLDGIDFQGKTVLDIGCWDGYWSFYAERRGAKHVLATDITTQRWSKLSAAKLQVASSAMVPNEGFALAHEVFKSNVEYNGNVSVYDVAALGKRFDIVLCLGVFYHLTHPMYALTQLRHAVQDDGLLVVESAIINEDQRSYMDFYYDCEDGNEPYRRMDQSNWVLPTRRCLADMVKANYFDVLDQAYLVHGKEDVYVKEALPGFLDRTIQRSLRALCRRYDVPLFVDAQYGRAILQAKAARRADHNHFYVPLVGLGRYDSRFNGT